MRDKVLGIGGMNHFMLPQQGKYGTNTWTDFAARYGSYAMEHLINNILKNGGTRSNLEIKLTGGGKIIAKMTDVGAKNIAFALDYLQTENLALTTQDVGDIYPRKIIYFPASGRLRVKKLRTLQNNTVIQREQVYLDELIAQSGFGEVELF
jgi:chemotaxis protein CheD